MNSVTAEQATRNSRPEESYTLAKSSRSWLQYSDHAESDLGAYESARITNDVGESARLRKSIQQMHAGEVLWDELPPPSE
jgi:hypothetical protein